MPLRSLIFKMKTINSRRGPEKSDRPAEKRTFRTKSSSERRTSASRDERGEHKAYGERKFGGRGEHGGRSFGARGADREMGSSRERKGYGERSFDRGSYGEGGVKRGFGSRSFGEKRAYGDRNSDARGERRGFDARGGRRSFAGRGERSGFGGRTRSFDKGFENRENFAERPFKRRRSEIDEIRNEIAEMSDLPVERKSTYRPKAQEYIPKPRVPKAEGEEGIRLNKFIANSGICSRREADEFITAGVISVNGQVVTELGTKVFRSDVVKFNDETVKGEEKVYLIMNKPKGFVTTTSDPHAEKTVIDIVAGKCPQRVYPVGRLDKDTTGVLLLTNDGDLTERLTHPSFEKKKIYQVFLDKNLKRTDFEQILKGVKLEDGMAKADALSYIDEDESQVGIEIHNGKNRIVRRIFDSLGYRVKRLDRVYFAGLTKKGLRRGQWRFLTDKEVAMLMMGSYE